MIKFVQIGFTIIVTSLFLFPFIFSFFPIANTKMILAVLGLLAFIFDIGNSKERFNKEFVTLSLWAFAVSMISFVSMVINNTKDDSYASYLISMWVWLAAAYFCVRLIKNIHGHVSVELVGFYLVAVGLMQCGLAVLIDNYEPLKSLVESYITGEKYMGVGVKERLYGIGCALDVGGGRLGAVLIVIAYLIHWSYNKLKSIKLVVLLLISFVIILVVGCMIGRTAMVGGLLGISLLAFLTIKNTDTKSMAKLLNALLLVLSVSVIVCVYAYNNYPNAQKLLRFGFEGFFNYYENGTFETNSTNLLSKGMIFPDNWKTWIIGDGYFKSGLNDPYYTGPSDYGFYMNTDAGYSRFIFYFGVTGLAIFSCFFLKVCRVCISHCKHAKYLFLSILLLNFCIWIKVSTDLFVIFAPFLCVYADEESDFNKWLESSDIFLKKA